MRGLALISPGNFVEKAWEEPALYGEPAPGVHIKQAGTEPGHVISLATKITAIAVYGIPLKVFYHQRSFSIKGLP